MSSSRSCLWRTKRGGSSHKKTIEALREAVGDPFANALPLHIYESAFSAIRRAKYGDATETLAEASAAAAETLSAGSSSDTDETAESDVDPATLQIDPHAMATQWTKTLLLVVRNRGQVGRVEAEVVLALVLRVGAEIELHRKTCPCSMVCFLGVSACQVVNCISAELTS